MNSYQPSVKVLQKYADVLVNYALNSGHGVKKGEVVQCVVPDIAKPLGLQLQNVLLQAGAQPLIRLIPTGFSKDFFALANQAQLTFFPKAYLKSRVKLIDHNIAIIADPDPEELKAIDPQKIILNRDSQKPYKDWLTQKEVKGKFTWVAALWGTAAKAKLVGLSYRSYWQQIIKTCFIDQENPIVSWKKISRLQTEILKKLNALPIQLIKVKAKDVNLTFSLGKNRRWQGGSGRNIPSFEIFTSPDWSGTNGLITFNQTLYRYGQIIKGISLKFKNGLVIKGYAQQGNRLLQAMLKSKNANKVGEFSLTDNRLSRLTHIMAETLFDENLGGQFGNFHLALGAAYKDCYRGSSKSLTPADWQRLGFNDSAEHTDIITTTDRTVTVTLNSGKKLIIYRSGRFTL
ncbi:MAG: aminopeptidase [Candidatus Beckwithbacteria bacterium]